MSDLQIRFLMKRLFTTCIKSRKLKTELWGGAMQLRFLGFVSFCRQVRMKAKVAIDRININVKPGRFARYF